MSGCLGLMAIVVGSDVTGRFNLTLCSTSIRKVLQREMIILPDK